MKKEKKNNKVELQDNHLYINGRLLRKGEIVNIEYPKMNILARYLGYNPLRNLFEFANLKTPMIAVVIGEGGSGGALAIGVADKLAMMRNSVFSVISPEGCAAILWNDPSKQEQATKALKITADDLKSLNLIDDVIEEPINGAHRDKETAVKALASYFITELDKLEKLKVDELLNARIAKILSAGAFEEGK